MQVYLKKLKPLAQLPERKTEYAAGYDLYSANESDLIIKPGTLQQVPTGIAISLPIGFEAQIRPRSGLSAKNQIGVLNSPGTIDADYRGEIQVLLYNFGKEDFVVEPLMRIAQMVIQKHEVAEFKIVENLDETTRGDGGFGHTSVY